MGTWKKSDGRSPGGLLLLIQELIKPSGKWDGDAAARTDEYLTAALAEARANLSYVEELPPEKRERLYSGYCEVYAPADRIEALRAPVDRWHPETEPGREVLEALQKFIPKGERALLRLESKESSVPDRETWWEDVLSFHQKKVQELEAELEYREDVKRKRAAWMQALSVDLDKLKQQA